MSTVYTLNGKVLKNAANDKWLKKAGLPAYTLRLRFTNGVTPTNSKGTLTQVSSSPNVWDWTYNNANWAEAWLGNNTLLEVIDGNTSDVTDMSFVFFNCSALTAVPLLDTANVTNMNGMFCSTALTTAPLFDTANVTNMIRMFDGCRSLTSVPLFDTSKVTNMFWMFQDCASLTSVPLFDTSNVTNMESMFSGCSVLTAVPLFNTSKVTYMSTTFQNCYKVASGALALYQQASSQATPPSSHVITFQNCGRDTTTGAAELAQIPSSWGGTGA